MSNVCARELTVCGCAAFTLQWFDCLNSSCVDSSEEEVSIYISKWAIYALLCQSRQHITFQTIIEALADNPIHYWQIVKDIKMLKATYEVK